MFNRLKSIIKKLEFKDKKSTNKKKSIDLDEEKIQLIAEYALKKYMEQYGTREDIPSDVSNHFKSLRSDILEPKKKFLEQKEFSTGVRIGGIVLLGLCIFYWIWYFFIIKQYENLTYSVYITLILIAITLINKFESVLLNSITIIPVYGFLVFTIGSILVTDNIIDFIIGPMLYGIVAGFQLFLVLHKRIPVSKRYMIWGFLFYLLFISSFESFSHINVILGREESLPELATSVLSFYILTTTYIVIYVWKKYYGILLP
ncbi:MAG: hypothetical protein EU539_07175 [Promethearchaeota archaeon]|nr:MAG: hypothetical protein EU539_07175 [Candidatus Lokiarchaeota archaeon]